MAVVIASNLRKEFAGNLLFEGVSFKLERRDRLALAGPNGAGKTTLMRMLTGETSVDGGELVIEKGTRVALHDQRPPLDRGHTLREYVLSGASDLLATERELERLEQAMAGGDHDEATLGAYARAQTRLEHAGGYGWRDHIGAVAARPRLPRWRFRPAALDLLRRRDHPRVAGARARRRSRSDPPRRADQPPRRGEPGMARARARLAGRRVHHRRARPLVPRGGHERHARARGRPRDLLSRALARLANREGAAGSPRAEDGRPRRGRHRAARALRRALPLQEEQGQAGPGQADADRPPGQGEGRRRLGGDAPDPEDARARLRLRPAEAERPRRPRSRGRHRGGAGAQAPRRRDIRARTRGPCRARRPERQREDDSDRAGGRRGVQARSRRRGRLLLAAWARAGRARAACSTASSR